MTNTIQIQTLTNDDIASVYSGRDGACCCGCAGKHSYNPTHLDAAGKDRGYAVDADEVNPRMVTKVLGLIKKADPRDLDIEPNYIATTVGNRIYIAYLASALR